MRFLPWLRWPRPTPGLIIAILLIVECLLWLSNWLDWPHWHKGYAVLVAVAGVGIVLLAMLLWFFVALFFRLRFQFSIRTMLVASVAVALPFSWLAVEMKNASEQAKVVAKIAHGGGDCQYEWQFGDTADYAHDPKLPMLPFAQPNGPAWLRGLLGDDFFAEIVIVDFSGGFKEFTEARRGAFCLNRIRQLHLNRDSGQVTDADLECLETLPKLQMLVFVVTDRSPSPNKEKLQTALPKCDVLGFVIAV